MKTTLFASAALAAGLLVSGAALAQTSPMMGKCDEAGMKMANDSMMKKDEKGCMMHMQKAMDMMK